MLKLAAVTVKRADRLAAVQSLAVAVSMRPDSDVFLASLADHAAMAGMDHGAMAGKPHLCYRRPTPQHGNQLGQGLHLFPPALIAVFGRVGGIRDNAS